MNKSSTLNNSQQDMFQAETDEIVSYMGAVFNALLHAQFQQQFEEACKGYEQWVDMQEEILERHEEINRIINTK